MGDQKDKAQTNIEIQHDPAKQNPNLPVEAQMEKAGEAPPIERQYQDSPSDAFPLSSTHDRDSVQPPDPQRAATRYAPEMPLKKKKEDQ